MGDRVKAEWGGDEARRAEEWMIRSELNAGGDEACRAEEWMIGSELNAGGDEACRAEGWVRIGLQKPKLCLGTAH